MVAHYVLKNSMEKADWTQDAGFGAKPLWVPVLIELYANTNEA